MGPLTNLLKMMPGAGQMKKMMRQLQSGRMPNLQQLAGGR